MHTAELCFNLDILYDFLMKKSLIRQKQHLTENDHDKLTIYYKSLNKRLGDQSFREKKWHFFSLSHNKCTT